MAPLVLGGAVQRALRPPPVLRHARDPRHLDDAWLDAKAARTAARAAGAGVKEDAEFVKDAGGVGLSYHAPSAPLRTRPLRSELRPPRRELDVVHTIEALRRLRREVGLFRDFSLQELEAFAEACSPLSFAASQVLFVRGELAVWFGILLSGQAVAYVPDDTGERIILGAHGKGDVLGAVRVSLWERSHARAYTLQATESGYLAVLTFDQLEGLRRTKPALHFALLRELLARLADAAGGFFLGCPLSCGTRWPIVAFHERRLLEFFLRLRDDGKMFQNVDYRALLALSCRLRVTQWQARASVLTRGAPLTAALLVLDGRLTGFRDPGGAPTAWYGPGDAVGLEGALGGARPCPVDVFAARPTLAALLCAEDLQDLGREFPSFASEVVRSLYNMLLAELADPCGHGLLLLAEGSAPVRFAPGDSPLLLPVSRRSVGGLAPADARAALRLADSTAPSTTRSRSLPSESSGPIGAMGAGCSLLSDSLAARDDATLHGLLEGVSGPTTMQGEQPAWFLGEFFSRKLSEFRASRAELAQEARLAASRSGATCIAGRPASAPPHVSRFHPLLLPAQARRPGSSPSDLVKNAQGLDVTAAEFDPSVTTAPHTTGLRRALATARGAARSREIEQRVRGHHSIAQPWAVRRAARSAPPEATGRRRSLSPQSLERSWRGASSALAAQSVRSAADSNACCPSCGAPMSAAARPQLVGRDVDCSDLERVASLSRSVLPLRSSDCGGDVRGGGGGRNGPSPGLGSAATVLGAAAPLAVAESCHSPLASLAQTPRLVDSGHVASAQAEDLWWYFEQQRRFLFDLRTAAVNPEEAVAADQQQAWNLKVVSQQHDIDRLQAKVRELEAANSKAHEDLACALRERDEWKASALRMQMNKEFSGMVESLSKDERRFLQPTIGTSMPDFGRCMRQQLELLAADPPGGHGLSAEGPIKRHEDLEHRPPPALRTFPRAAGAGLL